MGETESFIHLLLRHSQASRKLDSGPSLKAPLVLKRSNLPRGLFQAEECVILGFYELMELPLGKERGSGPTLTQEEISVELCFPSFLNSCIKVFLVIPEKDLDPPPHPTCEAHAIPEDTRWQRAVTAPERTVPCWGEALGALRGDGGGGGLQATLPQDSALVTMRGRFRSEGLTFWSPA